MFSLGRAIAIASSLHISQVDKGGNPYILHPLRIMMRLRTTDNELMAIAVLHDAIEDSDFTYDELRSSGMTERVISGVKALTKVRGESYDQYLDRVMQNKDAMIVKREDLRDNSDITRMKGLTEKDMKRLEKYMKSFKMIDEKLKTL